MKNQLNVVGKNISYMDPMWSKNDKYEEKRHESWTNYDISIWKKNILSNKNIQNYSASYFALHQNV